jgi:cytochrome P450 / NADPH-cytochrome P450 reductase
MTELGARKLAPVGFADAARGTLYSDFEEWLDTSFWPSVSSTKQPEQVAGDEQVVDISTDARATSLRHDVSPATVVDNHQLTGPGEPVKMHMELQLPSDVTYECGDYLAVLPLNSDKKVRQILAHFGLPWDAVMTLKTDSPTSIPANVPLSCLDVLRSYVELGQPATKKVCRPEQCSLLQYSAASSHADHHAEPSHPRQLHAIYCRGGPPQVTLL